MISESSFIFFSLPAVSLCSQFRKARIRPAMRSGSPPIPTPPHSPLMGIPAPYPPPLSPQAQPPSGPHIAAMRGRPPSPRCSPYPHSSQRPRQTPSPPPPPVPLCRALCWGRRGALRPWGRAVTPRLRTPGWDALLCALRAGASAAPIWVLLSPSHFCGGLEGEGGLWGCVGFFWLFFSFFPPLFPVAKLVFFLVAVAAPFRPHFGVFAFCSPGRGCAAGGGMGLWCPLAITVSHPIAIAPRCPSAVPQHPSTLRPFGGFGPR